MRRADRVSAALLLLFASFVIVQARQLPYGHPHAPGPGFLPLWLGVVLAVLSIALFVVSRGSAPPTVRPQPDATTPLTPGAGRAPARWLPDRASGMRLAVVVLLSFGAAALTTVSGMVLASGAYMAAVLFCFAPRRLARNIAAAVMTPLVVWAIFVYWLSVPLPAGPLGF